MTFPSSNDLPTTCSYNAQHERSHLPTFNLIEAHQEQVHDLLLNLNNSISPSQGPHSQLAPDNQQAAAQNQLKKIQSIIDSALALLDEDEDFLDW
jgi:hypothetical protein